MTDEVQDNQEGERRRVLHGLIVRAFQTQDSLNARLTPDWAKQGWAYYRAAWIEFAEAMGHMNWSWWKAGSYGNPMNEGQRAQFRLEMVDILHFGLSMHLVSVDVLAARAGEDRAGEVVGYLCDTYINEFSATNKALDIADEIENLVCTLIRQTRFDVAGFARICKAVDLTLPQLLLYYFAKGELNKFRWANGYKEGTYIKQWPATDGTRKMVEDNEVLTATVETLLQTFDENELLMRMRDELPQRYIYSSLQDAYPGSAA